MQIKKFPCLFSFHVNHVNTSFCCAVSQVIKLLFYYRSFNEIRIRFKTNFVNFEQLLHEVGRELLSKKSHESHFGDIDFLNLS